VNRPSDAPAAPSLSPNTNGRAMSHGPLDRVLDIPLTIHVELGRRKMKIRDLLEMGAGAIVDLATQAGAPLAIYANQTLIAEGEAVIVGDRYGVRITDIVSPAERVRRLGGQEVGP
jgi:flagellar motor switch protein FliN/FliY